MYTLWNTYHGGAVVRRSEGLMKYSFSVVPFESRHQKVIFKFLNIMPFDVNLKLFK